MIRFSGGEKLLIAIMIVLLVINPVYAIIYYLVFNFYKLKDYKISDYLLLLLTIIAVVNMIEAVITNAVDENYMSYLLVSASTTMIRGMGPFILVIPLFNYLMIRRYYNMELTMQDRILDSQFKIKEDERTILDKEVIDSNSRFEYKPNYFRLGVNKNLDKVYYDESSQNAMIFGATGTGKTNTVMNIIKDSLLHGNQLLYVNGKGNLEDTKQVIEMCTQNRKEYIFINIGEENEIKYNPFKNANATTIRDMLLSLSDWSAEHYKTNASAYYQVVLNLINLEIFDLYVHQYKSVDFVRNYAKEKGIEFRHPLERLSNTLYRGYVNVPKDSDNRFDVCEPIFSEEDMKAIETRKHHNQIHYGYKHKYKFRNKVIINGLNAKHTKKIKNGKEYNYYYVKGSLYVNESKIVEFVNNQLKLKEEKLKEKITEQVSDLTYELAIGSITKKEFDKKYLNIYKCNSQIDVTNMKIYIKSSIENKNKILEFTFE